jgi:hypothetical protein
MQAEISHESLSTVLKAYAVYNPELNYCQGMNFIAGFLLASFKKSEAMAFTVMREVVERYQMQTLFNEELP